LTSLISLFKVFSLPYPAGQWAMDGPVFLATYAFLQYVRIASGKHGNRAESRGATLFMIGLAAFSLFCNFYFVFLQTYT
jgi:hypothetical protein